MTTDGDPPAGNGAPKPTSPVKLAYNNAEPKGQRKEKGARPASPLPEAPPSEYGPPDFLPADCPVKALGKKKSTYYVLDSIAQLLEFKASEINRLNIVGMFGGDFYLIQQWPELDKDGIPKKHRWQHDRVGPLLIAACTKKGEWDPYENERGPGVWKEDDGTMVVHLGDRLYVGKSPASTGLRGRMLYPRAPAIAEPIFGAAGGLKGPAATLLAKAGTWNFERGEIDAKLFVGLIGCQMLGAAASWRAQCWLTGGLGTGKSTLQKLIRWLHGANGIIQGENTTQAGLARVIGRSSLPVSLDEFEAKADSRQIDEVIELMTIASSGGKRTRARTDGSDGAVSQQLCTCFIASSVNMPNLQETVRSRLAILSLQPIANTEEPDREPGEDDAAVLPSEDDEAELVLGTRETWAKIGRELKGRLIEQWYRYKNTFWAFRAALRKMHKYDHRAADQFGAIGAAFDCLMHDDFDSGRAIDWARMLPPSKLGETDRLEAGRSCLSHLIEQMPDLFRGGAKETFAHWIAAARDELLMNKVDGEAQTTLANYGIRVYCSASSFQNVRALKAAGAKGAEDGYQFFVAIATAHAGLAKFFTGTRWKLDPGTARGGWVQEFERLPLADYGRDCRILIGRQKLRVTILPWETVFPPADKDDDAAIAPGRL